MLTETTATTTGTTETNPQYKQLLQVAERLVQQSPDWVTFFREVMGIDGIVRRTFPSFDDLTAFERSEEFSQIQKLLVKLRESKATADAESEPTRVITVRLPKSMHEYLSHRGSRPAYEHEQALYLEVAANDRAGPDSSRPNCPAKASRHLAGPGSCSSIALGLHRSTAAVAPQPTMPQPAPQAPNPFSSTPSSHTPNPFKSNF